MVDDPYALGAIAAANAPSDVYAMGGRPLTALNLVGWPSGVLDFDVLGQVMRGGADKLAEKFGRQAGSWAESPPAERLLEEARELAAEGAIAGGTRRNLAALRGFVDSGDLDETEQLLVADAQTSGGLLIAVQPERLHELLARLRERGTPAAAHIGRLTDDPTGLIRIR